MTETTSVQPLIRERHVYAPAVERRFNAKTFMAQGAVGYIAGNFVVVLIEIILGNSDAEAVLYVPLILFLGALIGAPAGAFIWAAWELPNRPLNRIGGVLMGVMVVALAGFLFSFSLNWPIYRWLVEAILLPGIGIGLVTGSRLRPLHELIRVSDRVGPILRVFAGISGFVLRVTVAALFMVSGIALICILQSSYYQRIDRFWSIVAFAHFTAAMVLLFARIRIELLLPLAVIVNAPVVARLFMPPRLHELIPILAIWYLALWVMFLLTNWRQTPVAFSFLKEEFRYYLID